MKNILALLRKYYVFLIFVGLELISLSILFANNRYHQAEFLHHSSDMVGNIYERRARLSEYLRLGEINNKLSLEIAQLREQNPMSDFFIRRDYNPITDTAHFQRYSYRTAKVVNASVNREKNYLMIDRGSIGEVHPDMGVISDGNIVGVVRSVSDHFAIVMPIIHADFKASVRLKRLGIFGSLVWGRSRNPEIAEVQDIPKNIPVQIGDTIITTGYSSFFPSHVHAGIVEEIDDVSNNDNHILKIRLGANYRRLDHVLVVSDLMKTEADSLTQQIEQQDAANGPH